MPLLFSRRKMIGAGSAAALAPIAVMSTLVGAEAGLPSSVAGQPLTILIEPARVFDSRSAPAALGGGKLVGGTSLGVSLGGAAGGLNITAAYVNVTVTETEGGGFLVVRASDPTGTRPLPPTSNINWSANDQTLANLVVTAVGDENTIEVHAGGGGRTHFIVDVQAYVPFGGTV